MKLAAVYRLSTVAAAFALGVVLLPLHAGGEPSKGSNARKLLSTAELRALLSQGALFRSLPLDYVPAVWSREYFFADGRYQGCGHGSLPQANYRIEGARICLLFEAGKECRVLYRDGAGQLHEDLSRGSPPAVWLTTPIEIRPIPAGESCVTDAKR